MARDGQDSGMVGWCEYSLASLNIVANISVHRFREIRCRMKKTFLLNMNSEIVTRDTYTVELLTHLS